jgi:hypothetical protein
MYLIACQYKFGPGENLLLFLLMGGDNEALQKSRQVKKGKPSFRGLEAGTSCRGEFFPLYKLAYFTP